MSNNIEKWEDIADNIFDNKKIENNKKPEEIKTNNNIEYLDNFELMKLKEKLLRGIYGYGFEVPSKIQQCSIPLVIKGKDLIAQSQSGTGKTGAFTISMLQKIDETLKCIQGIIMVPTRELSIQIKSVIDELARYMNINIVLCIGGTSVNDNINDIKKSHIIVGTPGRINDMIERKAFNPKKVTLFCMDEADELLTKEFINKTRKIIVKLNQNTQICAFSATLSREALDVTNKFLIDPVNILVEKEKLSLDLIMQYYIDVGQDKYKLDVLEDLYSKFSIGQCIIYVNYKDRAEWLKNKLNDMGYAVNSIHSKLSPVERTAIMKEFRSGHCRVLISTDLLARGIDVQQVGYVINYDLPNDPANYLHRIGRSGRYGKKGVSVNFVTRKSMYIMRSLMARYSCKIDEMPDPTFVNEYLSS
jgi:translation initiation factor 4A